MVYDAGHVSSQAELPGKLVRAEGDKKAKDNTANEAYDNVGTVLEFFKDIFDWKSIDDKNADIISSVHFGEQYENACKWPPPPLCPPENTIRLTGK
jgi:Zn-dependent metalloprotease